ncbi:MAG TPA: KH domain-containing protein [Kiritimatiellia bacterium]|nr:KH domain-containing protein [Kiritimatiellia bacterium]HMP00114.1 KH domain-containing protein [Kiritimatiellia bacterium]HMP96575.1 KH domain-containing protein [Kiritimatiellia bacterium]
MALDLYVKKVLADLVDYPDALHITEVAGAKTTVFELRCHESDVGKVIGKNGKAISSVRTLLSLVAARQDKRVLLEVVE